MTMTQANGETLMSGMESPVAAGTARRKALGTMLVRLGAVGTFAVIFVYFALMAPGFLNFYNILNVVEQSAATGQASYSSADAKTQTLWPIDRRSREGRYALRRRHRR